MAVDTRTGNIYFADVKSQSIYLTSYDGQWTKQVYKGSDANVAVTRIGGIAVDIINKYNERMSFQAILIFFQWRQTDA